MYLLYRPQENHLGTVYRFGRFHRFAAPDAYTFMLPLIESSGTQIHLGKRVTALQLPGLMTSDGYPVDLHVKIFYAVDPRTIADSSFRLDALHFTQLHWTEIIHTGARDIAANQVFPALSRGRVFSTTIRQHIRDQLARRMSERLRPLGIVLDPATGVSIQDLQHNARMLDAVDLDLKAQPVGRANAERLRPLARMLQEVLLPDASMAYIWQVISTLQQGGKLPPQVGLLGTLAGPSVCPHCGESLQQPLIIGPG